MTNCRQCHSERWPYPCDKVPDPPAVTNSELLPSDPTGTSLPGPCARARSLCSALWRELARETPARAVPSLADRGQEACADVMKVTRRGPPAEHPGPVRAGALWVGGGGLPAPTQPEVGLCAERGPQPTASRCQPYTLKAVGSAHSPSEPRRPSPRTSGGRPGRLAARCHREAPAHPCRGLGLRGRGAQSELERTLDGGAALLPPRTPDPAQPLRLHGSWVLA